MRAVSFEPMDNNCLWHSSTTRQVSYNNIGAQQYVVQKSKSYNSVRQD